MARRSNGEAVPRSDPCRRDRVRAGLGALHQPIASEGTPSVLYVVLDDVGYSAMAASGGLIETPNIDRIAQRGLTYTNFHTTALCSPTRSCLMTGRPGRCRAGEAAGAHPAVVGAGGPVRGPAAGEPQCPRDHHHRPAAADQAAEPVRVLSRLRRGPRVGRAEHPQPLVHGRGRGHHRHPGRRRGPVRPRGPVRRPCPVHQGRQAQVRLQLRRRRRADRRVGRAAAHRPHGRLGLLRARGRLDARRGHPHPARGQAEIGQGRIKTQPGKFSIAGEGLNIGKDGAEPVTDDYPGEAPWSFTGGTIHQTAVDVSGEPFVDLAAEARMAFMRD